MTRTSTALRPRGQKYVRGTVDIVCFFFVYTYYTIYCLSGLPSAQPYQTSHDICGRVSTQHTASDEQCCTYPIHTRDMTLLLYARHFRKYTDYLSLSHFERLLFANFQYLLCGLQGDYHTQITLREGREALKHYLPMRQRQVRVKSTLPVVYAYVYISMLRLGTVAELFLRRESLDTLSIVFLFLLFFPFFFCFPPPPVAGTPTLGARAQSIYASGTRTFNVAKNASPGRDRHAYGRTKGQVCVQTSRVHISHNRTRVCDLLGDTIPNPISILTLTLIRYRYTQGND